MKKKCYNMTASFEKEVISYCKLEKNMLYYSELSRSTRLFIFRGDKNGK